MSKDFATIIARIFLSAPQAEINRIMSVFFTGIFTRKYISASAAVIYAAAAGCGAFSGAGFAVAADVAAKYLFPPAPQAMLAPPRPYSGICSSFFVRHEARGRFAQQMRGVPYEPPLLITAFNNISEQQYEEGPETYNITRHYCNATVTMNNGQNYAATYIVARNQGFAGIGGLHVSFCVDGLDNWLVRDNDCRSLRASVNKVY